MRLLITFARIYPLHSTIMVISLLLAGFMEGIGLAMLLPLLGIAVGKQSGSEQIPAAETGAADSMLERMVDDVFSTLGISPTVGGVLLVLPEISEPH